MADTRHEHAGNEDQRRQLQFDPAARCELCHYAEGYQLTNSDTVLALQAVDLPEGKQALFCQLCVALAATTKDGMATAARLIRPLPPETQPANDVRMAELTRVEFAEVQINQQVD